MAESTKPKLGDTVKAKHVIRPDGSEHDVSDGLYVLDVPGTHVIDGTPFEVK